MVVTGDVKHAGTDANVGYFGIILVNLTILNVVIYTHMQVFIRLKGMKGKLAKKRLAKLKKTKQRQKERKTGLYKRFSFERNSVNKFKLRGPDCGDLKSIVVEVMFDLI